MMDDSESVASAAVSYPLSDTQRHGILVLGMHRSGTSAVTRMMNFLGADLATGLMPPAADNPRGFWESRELMEIHDELLATGGSRWDDWQPFSLPNQTSEFKSAIRSRLVDFLQREFASSQLFVIKDPRICRFVPIWLEALRSFSAQPLAVIPVRHPFDVAHSLLQRDGIPFTKGCLLWLRHVVEAERTTRQIRRGFVSYERLVENWHAEAAQLSTKLGMSWSRPIQEAATGISKFLTADLRHHATPPQELAGRTDIVNWIRRAHQAIADLMTTGENETRYRELDQVRAEFDNACLAFGDLIRAEREESAQEALSTVIVATRGDFDARISDVEQHVEYLADTVSQQGEQTHDAIDQIRQNLAANRTDIDQLRNGYEKAIAGVRGVQAELQNQRHRSLRERLRRAFRKLHQVTKPIEKTFRIGRELTIGLVTFRWLRLNRHDVRLFFYKKRLIATGLFDAEWYLQQYPDVAAAKLDPLNHWLQFGVADGRNPNPYFDTSWYLQQHPHVAQQGQNPLVHYLRRGAEQGLNPSPTFRTRLYFQQHQELRETHQNPLAHFLANQAGHDRCSTEAA